MFVGVVVKFCPRGAFVEFAPGKDGMVHISKLSSERQSGGRTSSTSGIK
ncbi:MAG: S1 RNA-binding domain-containing protein [Christensenellaceae bacterium]